MRIIMTMTQGKRCVWNTSLIEEEKDAEWGGEKKVLESAE